MSTVNRALRPYPPVQPVITNTGTATRIDWYNRNRLSTAIVKQTDPTEALEDGQTTTIKIYDEDGVLIHTETGLTGTTFDYAFTDEIADAGELQRLLTFRLWSERDGYESLYFSSVEFDRFRVVVVGADTVVVGADRVTIF